MQKRSVAPAATFPHIHLPSPSAISGFSRPHSHSRRRHRSPTKEKRKKIGPFLLMQCCYPAVCYCSRVWLVGTGKVNTHS